MRDLCHLRHNGCEKALRSMTLFEHEGQRSLITEFTIHLFSLFQNRSYKAKEGRKTGIDKKSCYYRVLVVSIVVISGLHCNKQMSKINRFQEKKGVFFLPFF